MLTVIGVVWLSAPEVPVTITATRDVVVCCFELLLPHPSVISEIRSREPSTLIQSMLLPANGFRLRVVGTTPNNPSPGGKAIPGEP